MYTYKNKTEMERKLKIVIILFQPLNFNLSYYFQIKWYFIWNNKMKIYLNLLVYFLQSRV